MSPRNTNTGGVLETMVIPALKRGGYSIQKQVHVGIRLGKPTNNGKTGKHKIDAIAQKDEKSFLISAKWQQSGGTAEEKVPYEVMCLAEALQDNPGIYLKAYVVLGGDGWTLRDFYTSTGFHEYMNNTAAVQVVKLERFIALANNGEL